MKNGELKSLREKIQETEMFQSLGPVAQKISLARNNVSYIGHGVSVAKNIGYSKWRNDFQYNYRNQQIVKQILDNEKSVKHG